MKQGEHVRKFSKNYYNALNDSKKNYQKISDDVNNNSVDPVEIKKQAEDMDKIIEAFKKEIEDIWKDMGIELNLEEEDEEEL